MTLNERLHEAFDKCVGGTAMLPASELLSAMSAIEQAEAENAALKEQVAQWETEYNGCSTLLNNAERTIETLEETIAQQAEAIRLKDAALEKIACIGNGDTHGNSIGNCLAIDALALQPSPEILQDRDERVAEACAKELDARWDDAAAVEIRSGKWRKYL